jgi:hypothetical protein
MSNLWVIAWRSSGSLRRIGVRAARAAATAASTTSLGAAVVTALASFEVLSGCVRLLPSR